LLRARLGGWDAWDEGQGVAIGARLAQRLGVTIGDPVTIVNPNGTFTPLGKTPQIRSFPVNVIFDLGMVEFDSFYLYMPLEEARKIAESLRCPASSALLGTTVTADGGLTTGFDFRTGAEGSSA
jgi:ABC-type lipoprotein release transport system permease subunit